MISDVLAEIRISWELCLEANNERVEKVGQWRGPRYDRPNSTYLVQFWQNNLVSRVRFLDYEIQRSAVRPQNWYENPTKNPKLESVSSQQGIRLKENQACPPLREWPDCCVEFVATGPSLEKGARFCWVAEHWLVGCFAPHLKQTWSNRQPAQYLPPWTVQQDPLGKDWRGPDRVETPELTLSELNCDFVRKFITALSHSSQCTESQGYWSGADCLR